MYCMCLVLFNWVVPCKLKCKFILTCSASRFAGQVGFVVCGIRNSKDAQIGDTFFHPHTPVEPLQGFKPMNSMVS